MAGPDVKPGYPDKLSSEEIKEEMNKIRKFANGGGYNSELILAANSMIQSGQIELNDRFTKKTFFMMLSVTILSTIASFISIYFSYRADKTNDTDIRWKGSKMRIFQNIKDFELR